MPQAKEIDDFNWLPNSNKIAYGYNPIRGDPVCYTGDCHMSGFGRSIFQLDYTNPPQGSCTTKLIPKNVELDCIPSTEVREKTQKISNLIELKESGEIYKNDQKLNEWFQTIPDNPVIIKFTIQSIFDLITPERFPNDTNIQEKAGYIMQALEEYVNKTSTVYCENQCTNAAQGTCQPLGAYAYGICVCSNGFSGFDCSRPPPPTTTTVAPTV
ncbi:unnamed protein product [Rotaria sordida]|uniref:EGF-like domain-containing protein n=1 Tax=Rotaria sordida TaxID=392033 RepID=A0A815GNJ5_9BILA|nr:unnamed protein product [Rotaria sordida]